MSLADTVVGGKLNQLRSNSSKINNRIYSIIDMKSLDWKY